MAGKNISVDRCFEDAEETGVLNLCGRNLKEFPDISEDRELIDVIECDISKNRFSELPPVVCEFVMLERLNCHHNNIRFIPDSSQLTSLTWLNLSRNQLLSIPDHVCGLPLKVLIVSNNKLSTIPDDIRLLKYIQYLDLSCNELKSLPDTIGELSTLKELNVRRNHLEKFPDEMCKLKLVRLDFSCNRITVIPTTFRFLTTLTDLVLDNNPLQSPPAQLCTRGRGHIFKYLAITAQTLEKGKDYNGKYPASQRNSESILTEANLLPGRAVGDTPKNRSLSDQKSDNKVVRIPSRNSLVEAELIRTQQLLAQEQQLEEVIDEVGTSMDIPKVPGDDLILREASRKLQILREKQREDARQKHVEESRVYQSNRSLERRKVHNIAGNAKPASVVKVVGHDNRSNVVKKVEVTDHLRDDLRDSRKEAQLSRKKVESERRKIQKGSDADEHSISDEDRDYDEEAVPFPGIRKRNKLATPLSAYSSLASKFTVRRMYESAREEFEKVELLREAIESRLKVKLPDDIPACLADGTVLCHLINYLRKGTIPSIYVPTPNMPKLTMSKCLKNVDQFLSGCLKLGVERDKLCNPADIVQEKNPGNVWTTVEALLAETKQTALDELLKRSQEDMLPLGGW